MFLFFIPAGTFCEIQFGSSMLLPFAAVYGGVMLFLQDRAINWSCPACGKPFLRKKGTGLALLFRARCGNCGLQHGA